MKILSRLRSPNGPDTEGPRDLTIEDFAARARAFLLEDPVAATTPLTVLTEGLRSDHELFLVEDGAGQPELAALRTPPFPLILGRGTARAAAALGARRRELDRLSPLSGFTGPTALVEAFGEGYGRAQGATATPALTVEMRLYELGSLTPPESSPPGRARPAIPADRATLLRFFEEFAVAVHMPPGANHAPRVDAGIADGSLTVWESPTGEPESVAQHSPPVADVSRIRHVYTPAELRGRGLASAVTAAAATRALTAARRVVLFTDLANPTSNSIYQKLGFRPHGDYREVKLGSLA
jgi:ribosomal protein S18 acetylase RimI-like enzyme